MVRAGDRPSTGRASATWASKRAGRRLAVTIEPFEPLDAPRSRTAIDAEVADIGRFEGARATVA